MLNARKSLRPLWLTAANMALRSVPVALALAPTNVRFEAGQRPTNVGCRTSISSKKPLVQKKIFHKERRVLSVYRNIVDISMRYHESRVTSFEPENVRLVVISLTE